MKGRDMVDYVVIIFILATATLLGYFCLVGLQALDLFWTILEEGTK